MRLFEVDQGSAREVLAVLQGLANKDGNTSEIPFKAVLNIIRPFALGIATPDGLIALKNNIDPQGDVIQDVKPDGTIILNTDVPGQDDDQVAPQPKTAGPGVDQMASHNAKSAIK